MTNALEAGIRPNTLRLLSEGHRFSPYYGGYLANHLPMALAALDGMGATDAQTDAFANGYEKKLEPLPPESGTITDENASRFLGRRVTVASWIAYFEDSISHRGATETLGRWLDRLMPAVGSTAFHGLIRTAYALEGGVDRELAHALASWAADYTELGPLPRLSGTASPAEALAAVNRDPRFAKRRYTGGSIAVRMSRAAADPELAPLIAGVDPRRLDIGSQARALLRAYADTGNFTVLHGVTASLAFRVLLPFMKDADAAQGYLWQALVCAYLSAGGPAAGSPLKGDEGLSWPEIHGLAVASTDEHDIKLAYTCWQEWQDSGDDLYRRAASATLAPTAAAR